VQIDCSGVERFLSYADGEVSLSQVWNHPGFDIIQEHAALLGRELTREDVSGAVDGEQTSFSGVKNLTENRDQIVRLVGYVQSRESEWIDQVDQQLRRVTLDADVPDATIYLGIGCEIGIGVKSGAYINLNEPLFHRMPRQLLYTVIHESSHVLHEREHHSISRLGPRPLASNDQQAVWNTVFHTEAYATYTPLRLRQVDGNTGECDHPMSEDYRVLSNETQLRNLVEEYDSFRETICRESVSRKVLFAHLFGGSRLPYRVGCALIREIERIEGLDAVQEAFYTDPVKFPEQYDWALDKYRTNT
jgi:hypothetical protein